MSKKYRIKRCDDEGDWKWLVMKKHWYGWGWVYHSHCYHECIEYIEKAITNKI